MFLSGYKKTQMDKCPFDSTVCKFLILMSRVNVVVLGKWRPFRNKTRQSRGKLRNLRLPEPDMRL